MLIASIAFFAPAYAEALPDEALCAFFKALLERDYAKCWELTAPNTQDAIVELTYKSIEEAVSKSSSDKARELMKELTPDSLRIVFAEGKSKGEDIPFVGYYWKSFVGDSDVEAASQQKWIPGGFITVNGKPKWNPGVMATINGRQIYVLKNEPSIAADKPGFLMINDGKGWKVDFLHKYEEYATGKAAFSQNNSTAQNVSPSKDDDQQILLEGEILIPAGIYNNSSAYDSLAPYAAYESGKKALEEDNPNGYAMLASSARRGCNQARMYLAKIFMPADSPLNDTNISIVLEDKELRSLDRLERYEQYMKQAADNNSLTAAKALVALYGEDKYTLKNPELVFKYTKICALQKDPASMYKLGYLYSKGQGCQKDRAAAVKWMKDAAHAGSRDAKQWIEDRRGHYVEEQVLASTSRRSYSEMLAEVGDSSSSFDSFAKGLYRTYGGYSGYKDLIKVHAARYTITPTTFHRYFSEYDDGIYNICGIVAMEPYYNCTVLTDGNRSVVVYCPNLPAGSCGFAVKMLVYGGKASSLSGGRTSLYSPGISDSADAVGRNYRTVKKWKGPKIGGWEDLLK